MAGNRNSGRKDKHTRDALILEMKSREQEGDKRGMRKVASEVWNLAEGGERWAAEFIRDTIDGRPTQQVDVDHDVTGDFADFLQRIADNGKRLAES